MALASNALTLVAMVEQALGLVPGENTPALERLINAQSDAIERYCNRSFAKATATEKYRGHGGYRLVLDRTPVISITSISYEGVELDASGYELEDPKAGLVWRDACWMWTAQLADAASPYYLPGSEKASYSVTYVAGYVTPYQQATTVGATRDLPYELEQACIDAVCSAWASLGTDKRIRSETVLSASVTYDADPRSMPAEVRDALNRFRRPV